MEKFADLILTVLYPESIIEVCGNAGIKAMKKQKRYYVEQCKTHNFFLIFGVKL